MLASLWESRVITAARAGGGRLVAALVVLSLTSCGGANRNSPSARRVSWPEVQDALAGVQARYRPTLEDWEKGDEHLARSLTSLLEELKGREITAARRYAMLMADGGDPRMSGSAEVNQALDQVRRLFERIGLTPAATARKVSWEKLEAMVAGLEKAFSAIRVTRQDWEHSDELVIAKLNALHAYFKGQEQNAIREGGDQFYFQNLEFQVEDALQEFEASGSQSGSPTRTKPAQ